MFRVVVALVVALPFLAGCATEELSPIECTDGYMAPAADGCSAEHGGARDEFMEGLQSDVDQLPDGRPVGYVCGDGWVSSSVGEQGACSSHLGVFGLVYADGTRLLTEVSPWRIVHPDGSVESLDLTFD